MRRRASVTKINTAAQVAVPVTATMPLFAFAKPCPASRASPEQLHFIV